MARPTPYDEYFDDLMAAHSCTLKALDALYKDGGPQRSVWYRLALARAQSILIRLYKQEIHRKRNNET